MKSYAVRSSPNTLPLADRRRGTVCQVCNSFPATRFVWLEVETAPSSPGDAPEWFQLRYSLCRRCTPQVDPASITPEAPFGSLREDDWPEVRNDPFLARHAVRLERL